MKEKSKGFAAALILGLMFTLGEISRAETHNHKAHVHGAGKIDIAIENPNQAEIALDFPGDSIFGFEHAARSEVDKKTQEGAFKTLRAQASSVVRFDPSLGCEYTVGKVEIEKEQHDEAEAPDSHEGQHSDVNASYEVHCKGSLFGSKIQIGLMTLFPRIKKISVQILKDSGQTLKEVTHADESIPL